MVAQRTGPARTPYVPVPEALRRIVHYYPHAARPPELLALIRRRNIAYDASDVAYRKWEACRPTDPRRSAVLADYRRLDDLYQALAAAVDLAYSEWVDSLPLDCAS